jgi:hypothetical protein
MRLGAGLLLLVHGLIHLIGPTKAFGWAPVAALRSPISPAQGALWLVAAILLAGSGMALLGGARWWWITAFIGVALSQLLIATVWQDARFGTIANLLLLIPIGLTGLTARSGSLRSQFERNARTLLAATAESSSGLVAESDLVQLPPLMQAYLRAMGVIGKPHVRNLRLEFDSRMRNSNADPWMKAKAVQYEFFAPPARLFYMEASRAGIPFAVFHRYVGDSATFRVRLAELKESTNASGFEMTRSETVTLLNDIVVLAPAAVLELPIRFETTGANTVRATFSNSGHTVSADLTFNAAGELTGFLSQDRSAISAAGARRLPWSTPISDYRTIDGIRIGSHGEAIWVEPSGPWVYGTFQVTRIAYNVSSFHW